MNGLLEQSPLVELIHEISSSKMGGALRVSREKVKCGLLFDDGDVVFATSNMKAHRLRESLIRRNTVPGTQLPETLNDDELVQHLSRQGILDGRQLERSLLLQAEDVLRSALLWTEGGWEYDARARLSGTPAYRLQTATLLFEAGRRLPPEFAASRLHEQEILSPGQPGTVSGEIRPEEAFLLSRVETPLPVHELVALGGASPATEILHTAYALFLGGMLERPSFPRVFSEETETISRKPGVSPQAPRTGRYDPMSAGVEDDPEALRHEFEILFARVQAAENHYDVLELGRAADSAEIKRAYHALARRFHPDRFHHKADPGLLSRVEIVFARATQAYEALRYPASRATYDASIDAKRSGSSVASPLPDMASSTAENDRNAGGTSTGEQDGLDPIQRAEQSFQRGVAALRQGNISEATVRFNVAVTIAPKTAHYKAFYGHVLAANPATRRQGEAELQAAIAIEPKNASFHIMLAKLYVSLNLHKRALTSLGYALSLDPENEEAKSLIEKVNARLPGKAIRD
jgi:tetratricopeptide (TPR) repeat protein